MHVACTEGYIGCLKLLLSYQPDVEILVSEWFRHTDSVATIKHYGRFTYYIYMYMYVYVSVQCSTGIYNMYICSTLYVSYMYNYYNMHLSFRMTMA